MSIENPDADWFEQRLPVEHDDVGDVVLEDLPLEANLPDAADQQLPVPFDDEEAN